jgi:N-acetylmuramoyl-L-alanine amidase/FlgD Ig-like domain
VFRFSLLAASAFFALVVAPTASGSSVAHVKTVELQPVGTHGFRPSSAVSRFTLAGVSWRGRGTVLFRTRSTGGRWSAWRPGAPEDEDAPDEGSPERRRGAWKTGNPWWVGTSDRIQARTVGSVTRVRAHLVWSPETRIPLRIPAATEAPPIVPRLSWGANESIRRGPPSYAAEVRLAIVHHTAGRNDYSRAEAAAIVKGIQLFHVQGNGWNDIGYNFLVDRFGTVYEGRFGGVDRNVIGAHALGFNTGSVGIALLGTYGNTAPSVAAQQAIARLIAWRLDLAHVDPTAFLTYISGGSERYQSGIPVLLSAVSGHRDTGYTECPGTELYDRLGAIAAAARDIGGPKIFEPAAETSGSSVRVRARLSRPQAWTVAITNSSGAEVARGTGANTAVDWTWESAGMPAGSYTWTIAAGGARPASGVFKAGGGAAPLAIESLAAEPEAISPNGDGQADATVLTYRISAPANVTVEITDAIGGVVATVVDRTWTRAGQQSVTIDGAALADGDYNVVVTARTAAGASVQKLVPLSVNRTLGLVTVVPSAFSPNGDGRKDTLAIRYTISAPAVVRIRIEREGRWVASPLVGSFVPGPLGFTWNGQRVSGLLRDGAYVAVVEATGGVGVISYGVPFVSDTVAPRVRILPGKRLRVEVSEPSALTFVIDGQSLRTEVRTAGVVRIPWVGSAARVRVVAWDAAGNASGPVIRILSPD